MILGSLDAVDCAALRHHGIEQLGVSLNELLPTDNVELYMACKLAGGQQPTVRMIAPFSIFNCSVHQRLQRWLPEHLGRQQTKE